MAWLSELRQWLNFPLFSFGGTDLTLGGIFSALLVLLGSLLLSKILRKLLKLQLSDKLEMQGGILYALQRIIHYLVLTVGAVLSLQCIGFNLGSITVLLGFLGVGIGFGLQNITSNFVSGLILLLERPIRIGDMVSVEQHGEVVSGTVVEINIRSTLIRSFDHVAIIVPNSKLIENAVVNWSVDDLKVRIHVPIGVSYRSDEDQVTRILLDTARQNKTVLKTPEPIVRFLGFGDSSLDFELLAWVPLPDQRKLVLSELNYQIRKRFREEGVQIPFPQRDLHLQPADAVEKWLGGKS